MSVLLGVSVALTACRAIIGYSPLTLEETPDGSPEVDAHVGVPDASKLDASMHHDGSLPPHDTGTQADVVVITKPDVSTGFDASCPSVTPTVLFTTSATIVGSFGGTPLFVTSTYVYAEVFNLFSGENDASFEPFRGLIGCPKTGCSGTAQSIVDPNAVPDGSVWGSATGSEAGLYYAVDVPAGASTPGEIESANPDGGDKQTLVTHVGYPLYVAAADDTIYWADDPFVVANVYDDSAPWSVKVGKLGTLPLQNSVLFSAGSEAAPGTYGLFVDSRNVYAVAADPTSGEASLFVCPRLADGGGGCADGGAVELLTGLDPTDMGTPDSLTADGDSVYQATQVTGEIVRTDVATHSQTVLAMSLSSPANLVLAGTELYWSTSSGEILHMPKDGSKPPLPFVCSLSGVAAMAADGAHLYFVANSGSGQEVASVPLPQ